MIRRRVNRDTKHILYSNMPGEFKSVLEDGPIEGEPLVSVCVITYNHGKYIRQCLDGILMQKVNFPYEILIHDDASPDDTADIIREYWGKYPTVIKPILREENQYSKGVDVSRFNFDRAKAKYIALCEGDDYWTDEGKLQMQVDFLERHGEYVGTAHNVRVVDENGIDVPDEINQYPLYEIHRYTINDAEYMRLSGQSASLVSRNFEILCSKEILVAYYRCRGIGDRKLTILLSLLGDIHCFSETMSAYRYVTTSGTSWTARTKGKNLSNIMNNYYLDMMDFAKQHFSTHLHMEPYVLVNLLGSIKRVIITRKSDDCKVCWEIVSSSRVWKVVFRSFVMSPFDFLKRCYRIIWKLPQTSAVTY